jgi:hypothetical protein
VIVLGCVFVSLGNANKLSKHSDASNESVSPSLDGGNTNIYAIRCDNVKLFVYLPKSMVGSVTTKLPFSLASGHISVTKSSARFHLPGLILQRAN